MTPTPAETALWRALNREPKTHRRDYHPGYTTPHKTWQAGLEEFNASHPADRLAYFKGFAERAGYRLSVEQRPDGWCAGYHNSDRIIAGWVRPTQHEAEFHASARALAALGVITDDVMKEIEGHG